MIYRAVAVSDLEWVTMKDREILPKIYWKVPLSTRIYLQSWSTVGRKKINSIYEVSRTWSHRRDDLSHIVDLCVE